MRAAARPRPAPRRTFERVTNTFGETTTQQFGLAAISLEPPARRSLAYFFFFCGGASSVPAAARANGPSARAAAVKSTLR